jgi:hypothetical protein
MSQQPETKIKNEIKKWLNLFNWFCFPILQGMGAYKGISDIIAIKNGTVLFIEVKTPKGKQSEYQMKFEDMIKNYGGHYLIARSYRDVEDYINDHF